MSKIQVFKQEIADGLGELVKSTASVAYCSEATVHTGNVEVAKNIISDADILSKVIAENKDQIDLHYIESVLVSTGWNKNDDVFRADNTWSARNTPEDKQFNFGHDENDIIGHITGSYVLTKDGKAVADDDAASPDEFDIISQAVLYNSWTQLENKDRMEKIISEIKDGKWFVSMECLFAGFDYALVNPEGEAQVVARGEDSAFLTKHLRAYGGNGEYEGYKLGRALNNISFSGKGLVAKPANPRSVILNSKSTAQFKTNDINSNLIIGEKHMSDTMLLEKQLAEVQGELSSAKAENQAIKAKIEEAKDKEFASTVEAFEASADESQATISELEESIKSTQARVAELEDSLTTSENELAEAVKKVDEMKKKEEMNMRKEKMADAGFNEEEIEESMAGFESLSEDAFDVIVAMMKKKVKKKEEEAIRKPMASEEDAEAAMPPALKEAIEKKKKEKEEKDAKASDEEEVTAEHFEGVESTEATLIDSEDVVDEIESTRASVADWFANNVLSK
mgnify:CR=1 FL=1|tara:strand:- start:8142 stop:9671 length:1530 start_codon:yes stop_codon:yes gene_type:complete